MERNARTKIGPVHTWDSHPETELIIPEKIQVGTMER